MAVKLIRHQTLCLTTTAFSPERGLTGLQPLGRVKPRPRASLQESGRNKPQGCSTVAKPKQTTKSSRAKPPRQGAAPQTPKASTAAQTSVSQRALVAAGRDGAGARAGPLSATVQAKPRLRLPNKTGVKKPGGDTKPRNTRDALRPSRLARRVGPSLVPEPLQFFQRTRTLRKP